MVTNSPGSRRERKKAASRQQIIAAAIALFAKRGIHDVTVDEIARAADVGKGTIYNYFETKEDIVVAYLVDTEARAQAEIGALSKSRGKLDAILSEFVLRRLKLKEPYHVFTRVFQAQMYARTEQFLPTMIKMQQFLDPPIREFFCVAARTRQDSRGRRYRGPDSRLQDHAARHRRPVGDRRSALREYRKSGAAANEAIGRRLASTRLSLTLLSIAPR